MISPIAHLFVCLALIFSICHSAALPSRYAPRAIVLDDVAHLKPEYDYVVIGGGTSGLVVANRLTEDPNITVLVIEYGYVDSQDNGTSVPGLPVPGKYLRTYTSIPQPGLDNRTSPLYTGAVVGGGTVVNGMFFNRGSAGDYDAWEKLGNPGWGWKGLLPYFKKSETFTPPPKEILEDFQGIISTDLAPHGIDGPVGSSFSNYQYPIIHNFFRGWNSIGVRTQPQPNAGDANGAFYSPISLTAVNQSRSDASDAYYRPIPGKRDNFHLLTGSTVTKINFNRKKVAESVDFISRNGTNATQTAHASREIILAAGAARSPQVLQLSGIGPKPLLSSLGIKTIVDLPGVGRNFQDQPSMFMEFSCPMTIPNYSGSIVSFLPLQNITTNYSSIIASASSVNLSSLLLPSIDPTILAGYTDQRALLLSLYASPHAAVEEVAWEGGDTVSVAKIRPFSRGSIEINSTDPNEPPVIDFGTFSYPTDLTVAVKSLKKVRAWMASGPMQEVGAVETYPGVNVSSDAQIAKSIRTFATSSWQHPMSSCSMMRRELGGVVDHKLRVYGVKGLRVVDASVFPMAISGHISSTVYAVAEKAVDIIKAAQKQK